MEDMIINNDRYNIRNKNEKKLFDVYRRWAMNFYSKIYGDPIYLTQEELKTIFKKTLNTVLNFSKEVYKKLDSRVIYDIGCGSGIAEFYVNYINRKKFNNELLIIGIDNELYNEGISELKQKFNVQNNYFLKISNLESFFYQLKKYGGEMVGFSSNFGDPLYLTNMIFSSKIFSHFLYFDINTYVDPSKIRDISKISKENKEYEIKIICDASGHPKSIPLIGDLYIYLEKKKR